MIEAYEIMVAVEVGSKMSIAGTGLMSNNKKSTWLERELKRLRESASHTDLIHFIAKRPKSVGNGNYSWSRNCET